MKHKIKVLVSSIFLSLTISHANADVFGIVKRNPLATAVGVGFGTLYMQTTMHKARDLSYHLPKVDDYFKLKPQDFNPIAKYVLWALANPANKKDYDRYKRLAEVMGLDGIPPYVAPIHNQPTVLTNPAQEQDPNGNVLDNPIQEQPFSNIIYTPQGEKLDTSTEFPNETPKNWKEYLLLKQDSTELGKKIVAAEQQNDPTYVKPDNVAAHHMVSATSKDTKDARAILEKYLNSITPRGEKTYNNEVNGVLLPNINNADPSVPGILHNGRHPQDYNVEVNRLIVEADQRGGWTEVQKTLNDIKQELLNANRTDKWKNVL